MYQFAQKSHIFPRKETCVSRALNSRQKSPTYAQGQTYQYYVSARTHILIVLCDPHPHLRTHILIRRALLADIPTKRALMYPQNSLRLPPKNPVFIPATQPYVFAKQPYIPANEPYTPASERCISSKQPYMSRKGLKIQRTNTCTVAHKVSAKQPYIPGNEPYTPAKEPYISTCVSLKSLTFRRMDTCTAARDASTKQPCIPAIKP